MKEFAISVLVSLLVLTVVIAWANSRVEAKSQQPTATCTVWATSSPYNVSRCVDQDGLVCMISSSGMFQCLKD